MKAAIIFFSATGNTRRIADLLADRLRYRDWRVLLTPVDEAQISDVREADLVLLGSPAWSGERVVDPLKDFVCDAREWLRGKKVAFFGSYDWGEDRHFDALTAELRESGIEVRDAPCVTNAREGLPGPEAADAFLLDLTAQACTD